MSEKSKRILELMGKVELSAKPPEFKEGMTLLEHGMLCVLTRQLTSPQAHQTLKALRQAFPDWNELRISQVQEFRELLKTRRPEDAGVVAQQVKEYLNEIFWKNHGYDLEYLREDPTQAAKFFNDLPFLGASAGHYLLWVASGGELAISSAITRTLDRLGLVKRTGSVRKATEGLLPLVPEERRAEFGAVFGAVVEHWCDARKPRCWECPLLDDCPHGKKVFKDWKAQQVRLEAQRKREETRLAAQRKKDEERQRREDERRKKRAERDTKKLERERERQAKADEKRRLADEKKKQAEAKRQEAARKKADADKKQAEAARKQAAADKKAASKKKAPKKPAKSAAKKPAPKPKASGAKKKTGSSKAKKTTKRGTSRKAR